MNEPTDLTPQGLPHDGAQAASHSTEPNNRVIWTDAELDELLGVHALDAIENARERAAVEAYVARSPRARAELDAHRQVAAALGNAVISAPPELWARIADHLQPFAATNEAADGLTGKAKPTSPYFVLPGATSRRRRRSRFFGGASVSGNGAVSSSRPWIAAAAAAACVAGATGGFAFNRSTELRSATSANRQLRSDVAIARARASQLGTKLQAFQNTSPLRLRLAQLEDDPTVRNVQLVSSGGGSLGHVLLTPSGEGYIIGDTLPVLPAGRTYQLWGVKDGTILSLGVMGRSPKAMPFAGDEQWSQLVLTDEVSPGVAVSKASAAAVAKLDQA